MKKAILMLAGFGLSVLMAVAGESRVFALATTSDVEPELTARVMDYLETQSGAVVRPTDFMPVQAGQSIEEIGRAAAQRLAADEIGVLVLGRFGVDQPQGVCLPHEHFGILNLSRLGEGVDEDRLVRRAGQDGLRVLAMLVGLSPCPFPLCVLTGYEETEDLDRMSGNFCPPCLDRFTRRANEAHLQMKPGVADEPAEGPAADVPAADEPAADDDVSAPVE